MRGLWCCGCCSGGGVGKGRGMVRVKVVGLWLRDWRGRVG